MTRLPEFADNQSGKTLAHAIKKAINHYDDLFSSPPTLDIATAYFNPAGYLSISEELKKVGKIRLLLGAEPIKKDREIKKEPGELSNKKYKEKMLEESLKTLSQDIKEDRNLLGFEKETDRNLKKLINFLNSDQIKIKRYEKGFLHGKAYIFNKETGVLSGSSNFTGAGLNKNLELNLGQYQPSVTAKVNTWFENLWEESTDYDLSEIYEEQFNPYSPYLIYLRALWERYEEEIEEEISEKEGIIELTTFQNDGLFRAKRFLKKYHGVIIADSVGLGKTYIAGKLIEESVNENRQRALVIAPAALRDGMWNNFKAEMNIHFEIISYAQLRNEKQLGGNKATLKREIDEYQLIVADEAHTLRNPGTEQSQSLRRLLIGKPPKDLVMLTATPINNSLWDLYYLLRYFIKHDAVFSSQGITSLKDRFKKAQKKNPSELDPNMLFDVIDQTTVRRTRRFIKKYYDAEKIETENETIYINFPDPKVKRIDYRFDETIDNEYFADVSKGLAAGDNNDPELTLARYSTSQYIKGNNKDGSELSLIGLIRSGLLKRFESSRQAFANSLNRMIEQYEAALELIDYGKFPEPNALNEWIESDNDEAFEEAFDVNNFISIESKNIKKKKLVKDLKSDIEILTRWKDKAIKGNKLKDGKLKALKKTLIQIKKMADNDGLDEHEKREKRKVIIFSYFEDTVDLILDYLNIVVEENEELSCYKDRIAGVAGSKNKKGISKEEAVYGFAPKSTKAPKGTENKFDIIVSTEVLAQGVNLQQCRNVINYDLPWNPMRVVQRNGRIDRINSPHPKIYSYAFFPEQRLDSLLELELRIRKKLTQAARSIGLDSEVIPDIETVEQNFADKFDDIKDIKNEDNKILLSNESSAAFSGEELRQELREGLKEQEENIKSLPWGAGSGFIGDNPGYFFVARIGDKSFFRFVPFNRDKIVKDTLICLKNISCSNNTNRIISEDMKDNIYSVWKQAKEDIYKDWQKQTDPRNLEPEIRPLFQKIAEHLREYPPSEKTQKEIENTIDAVEAPWGRRYERELREIFDKEFSDGVEKSKHYIKKINELGLQPYETPEPLPRINKEQVRLICWMIISS